MPARARPLTTLLVAGILACGTAFSQNTQSTSEPEARTAPLASGGLRAYLDPATGQLIDHPPFGKSVLEFTPKALRHYSTSHFGLIEQVLPNGNRLVRLQGRFRQGSVATTQSDGNIRIHRIDGRMFLSPFGRKVNQRIHFGNFEQQEQERSNDE